ncbi:MAG: aldose epimerase family protein [Ferruginibacter sp.]
MITSKIFGSFENQDVIEYTLSNDQGMQVSVLSYGGIISRIIVADKNGLKENVVIGFNCMSEYQRYGHHYFGSLVGRFCNRIAKASFSLDGIVYKLAKNDKENSLHGGMKGFDKILWLVQPQEKNNSLKLSYTSKDGDEGYPGNLNVEVTYTLTDDNSIRIDYSASTDKPTVVNLTNHSYFNLSAGKVPDILGHELVIDANEFTIVDESLIPTGQFAGVKNTPMDFTIGKMIGTDIPPSGYDHNYVLNIESNKAASLYEPLSGRFMEVFTTEPGLQFYSGNSLQEIVSDNFKDGHLYKHGALCLEAQHFPDSPNHPEFPNTVIRPGDVYRQVTLYKFSVK